MFKVAIVHHLDMPIMRQRAFHIAPGTENQIPITPTLYTANPQVRSRQSNPPIFLLNRKLEVSSAQFSSTTFICLDRKIFTLPSLLFALNFNKIASGKDSGKKIIDLISHLWTEGSKFLALLLFISKT